ncbi:MAG TPA: thiamine diphosphokinase [Bacillota bacterium]|nr:thiamine diphosphokinase [Bacillota bacterium]
MKQAIIVGGGPISLTQLRGELQIRPDLLIAADRGAEYLLDIDIFPDIVIGDLDSLSPLALERIHQHGIIPKVFPVQKDQTDLELALDQAINFQVDHIKILGGLGNRLDHTFGNTGLLIKALKQGVEAHLLDLNHDLTVITQKIVLKEREGWAVSLIPLTETVKGVTTLGLAYPLNHEDLQIDATRGLHNEFTASQATVKIDGGFLLVIHFRIIPG